MRHRTLAWESTGLLDVRLLPSTIDSASLYSPCSQPVQKSNFSAVLVLNKGILSILRLQCSVRSIPSVEMYLRKLFHETKVGGNWYKQVAGSSPKKVCVCDLESSSSASSFPGAASDQQSCGNGAACQLLRPQTRPLQTHPRWLHQTETEGGEKVQCSVES